MKEREIKVLKVEPCKAPEQVMLKNKLEALQDAVSIGASYRGLIELLSIDDNICLMFNELGKILDLEPNRNLGFDIICGVLYVVREDEFGNLCSLTDEDVEKYKKIFADTSKITMSEQDRDKLLRIHIL